MVGMLFDATNKENGASLYFFINGVERKVAYEGLKGSYRFGIQLYNGEKGDKIVVIPHPKKPVLTKEGSMSWNAGRLMHKAATRKSARIWYKKVECTFIFYHSMHLQVYWNKFSL